MAHSSQLDFVRTVACEMPEYFMGTRVLEIGSLDINGSVRQFFKECEYTGIDVGPGPGVDVVCEGQEFDAPDGHFDVTVSCECMEHNPYWRETFQNMIRMTRPGGLVLITCATTGRKEHGTERTTPQDSPLTTSKGWTYYRNLTPRDFDGASKGLAAHRLWQFWDAFDLSMIGIREGHIPDSWARAVAAVDSRATLASRRSTRVRQVLANVGGDTGFNLLRHVGAAHWRIANLVAPLTDMRD